MKKFINRPENVVDEMLQGLTILNPGSSLLPGHSVMVRADAEQARNKQVAIISGGGSGHEPAHAGYIGEGMLSAAVAGEVFTSPDTDSILEAIKAVAGKTGALLVVKNYTGDRLNFGLAAEMARSEGIPVEMILVDDDIALDTSGLATGARGIAGTIFIHKMVGAAAAEGKSLSEVAAIGKAAISSLATMGVSFSAGISPAVGKPSFELAKDEMELGLGIHGEPGALRTKLQPADQLTETLLSRILPSRNFGDGKRIAVMINNLGATTEMELAIVARHALNYLEKNGLKVERLYSGTFLSSLDMAGISISVLAVNDDRLRWLDSPTSAPAWPNVAKQRPLAARTTAAPLVNSKTDIKLHNYEKSDLSRTLKKVIVVACEALTQAEPELTEMDRIAGDGDLGASMKRAAGAMQEALPAYALDSVSETLNALGHTLRHSLGGSSGPLYGVFFLRMSKSLENSGPINLAKWASTLEEGQRAISELGGAKPGDRTMLDALDPFVQTLKKAGNEPSHQVLAMAAAQALRGAQATAQMNARLGRSSYLRDRVLGHPDPGAMAVAILLRAVVEALTAVPANG